jgi:hypothetical protein
LTFRHTQTHTAAGVCDVKQKLLTCTLAYPVALHTPLRFDGAQRGAGARPPPVAIHAETRRRHLPPDAALLRVNLHPVICGDGPTSK